MGHCRQRVPPRQGRDSPPIDVVDLTIETDAPLSAQRGILKDRLRYIVDHQGRNPRFMYRADAGWVEVTL